MYWSVVKRDGMVRVTPVMHLHGWRPRSHGQNRLLWVIKSHASFRGAGTPLPDSRRESVLWPVAPRLTPHARNRGTRHLPLQASSNSAAAACALSLPRELKSRAARKKRPKPPPQAADYYKLERAQAQAGYGEDRRMAAETMQCRVNGGGGEGGGGMRTVECLRGRLLAERVASKAAKEEADQLAKRLDELEKQLADEVKVRNKAERRLRRAIKKLESLKILDVELSDGSISSLSSNGQSAHRAPEVGERNSPGSLTTDDSAPSGTQGGGDADADSAKGSSAGSCTQGNFSQDGSWCSVVSEQSPAGACMDLAGTNNSSSSEESAGDHDSERQHLDASSGCSSAKSEEPFHDSDDRLALVLVDPQLVAQADGGSRTEANDTQAAELHPVSHEEAQQEEENNRLAIVLADHQPQPAAAEPKPHADVESVLLALRRVKEQLRYTIERRSELVVAHRELYGH
ncbi:uncharacterized protein [Setaria viridis]|nr:uncharacterized protein LOC117837820 isoform X2 [Setaria viridis]